MSCYAKMLGLLVLALLGLAAARTGDRIPLVNYGVVLEERGDVDLNREDWVHTYSIQFPLDTDLTPDPEGSCIFTKAELCSHYPAVSTHLQRVKGVMLNEWHTLLGVYQSLPFTNFSMADPSTPQGQIINAIYTNIQDQKRDDNLNFLESTKFRSSSARLSSIEVVDQVNQLRRNLTSFKELVAGVEKKLRTNDMATLSADLNIATERVWEVHVSVQRISDTLNAARSNILTQDLLSEVPMEMTLINVERLMETKYHPFMVTRLGTTIDYYFNTDVPVYLHHEGDTLYVSVVYPLTYGPRYTAYQVLPFPLVYGDSAYGTLLSEVPDYFLLSSDGKRYATMTADQFAQCSESRAGVTTCPESHSSVGGSVRPHCLLGLLSENKTMIKQECQYGLLAAPLQPTVWEYIPGQVLLTRTEEALIKCDSDNHRIQAAPVQVVQLPCRCMLSANDIQVMDRLTGCAEVSTPSSLFPVNLGALLQVHSPESLKDFNGTTLQAVAPIVDLPSVALNPPVHQDLNDLHPGMALNLTSVMLKWRAGEKVFTSPVDALLDAERERLEAGPRVTVTTLGVLGGLIIIVCILTFCVLFKNHSNLAHRIHMLEHHTCFESDPPGQMVTLQVIANNSGPMSSGPMAMTYDENGEVERGLLTNGIDH